MKPADSPFQQLVRRLRQMEIQILKAVDAQLQGDFHSVFKGTGLEFDDVRLYQYGDEVRAIDWAVSSKGHGTFVKTYKEEREQQVLLLLDVSASQQVGAAGQRKLDVGREICGVLALAAARQDAQLGILAFSDQKELYLPPGKGHPPRLRPHQTPVRAGAPQPPDGRGGRHQAGAGAAAAAYPGAVDFRFY